MFKRHLVSGGNVELQFSVRGECLAYICVVNGALANPKNQRVYKVLVYFVVGLLFVGEPQSLWHQKFANIDLAQ